MKRPLFFNFVVQSYPFQFQDLISNTPYTLPHNSYDISLENLVLDQLKFSDRYFSIFSPLVCLVLRSHCKEKFSHGR